jgi:hypothetical protein
MVTLTREEMLKVPVVMLTAEEVADIETKIDAGQLPLDYMDLVADARTRNVYGHDYSTDRDGNPIEQGVGSAQNQTRNSIAAYKKYCDPKNPKAADPDPNFAENLKRMEKELVESNTRRAAAAAEAAAAKTALRARRAALAARGA